MFSLVHFEILLPTVVVFVSYGRGLGWLASQMSVLMENYFKDLIILKECFIIEVIIVFSFFIYKKKSFRTFHMCKFLAICLISIISSTFPKAWSFAERCWANCELLFLKESKCIFLTCVNITGDNIDIQPKEKKHGEKCFTFPFFCWETFCY